MTIRVLYAEALLAGAALSDSGLSFALQALIVAWTRPEWEQMCSRCRPGRAGGPLEQNNAQRESPRAALLPSVFGLAYGYKSYALPMNTAIAARVTLLSGQ